MSFGKCLNDRDDHKQIDRVIETEDMRRVKEEEKNARISKKSCGNVKVSLIFARRVHADFYSNIVEIRFGTNVCALK